MTPEALVASLEARGVTLVADGEHIRCRPKSALSAEDVENLRAHKPAILRTLRGGGTWNLACYACREQRFWRSIHGRVVCATCHPPAAPYLVVEWLEGCRSDERTAP